MQFQTFLRMFHLCFHHFNNQSNIITIVTILEMRVWMTCYLLLYQRSMATAFDKLSYSYRTSIAKYFDLVVTIEIYIYWPNIFFIFCAHMRKYCSSQQGKPLAGASARGLGGLWPRSPLHLAAQFTLRPAECPRMRRSRFLGDKGHYLTAPGKNVGLPWKSPYFYFVYFYFYFVCIV